MYGKCTGAAAGAIFTRDGGDGPEILLVERATEPYGFACPATHVVDPLEDWSAEVREERIRAVKDNALGGEFPWEDLVDVQLSQGLMRKIGLKLCGYERFHELLLENPCRRIDGNSTPHRWFIFEDCGTKGGFSFLRNPLEVKDARWVQVSALAAMDLEPVWREILTRLGYIHQEVAVHQSTREESEDDCAEK